jgi:filamentous hemagglutinin family protein
MLFCTVGFILLPTSYVWANPAGEAVVGGAATFQRDGNTLTVNQATDRLAVNWQSFNIAAGERTHFNMPSSTSAALNRVIGGNPSSIYGSLSANGILYLINPSGILVGPGGTVNAASFMASTLDVSTEQFMNAKNGAGMNFYGSSGESIINQGNITAEKGDVFLVAQKVENRGTINAANGTVGMVGSGQNTDVMVHEVGGNGFAIRVAQLQGEAATGSNRDLPDGEELLNEGTISAAQAELNASGNVYALAIRNSGTIRAKAVVANADGTVRLDGGLGDVINTGKMYAKNAGDDATAAGGKIDIAGQSITASPESIITAAGGEQGGSGGSVKIDSEDTTIVQGKVDVTAASAGAKGGKVQLLGERVGLFDGAKVDASGGAGGGTVLVGGDYLGGQAPSADLKDMAKQEAEPVKNAKAVVMAETAEIKADATVNGDGGKVVLWSGGYTGFYGKIFARGGAKGGNGGFVETSSHQNLQAFGTADASAPKGKAGQWLLDPYDIIIGSTDSGISASTPFLATGTTDPAQVSATTINTALNAGTSVTVKTVSGGGTNSTGTGSITVASNISKTNGTAATLTLDSVSTIGGNGSITSSGAGNALSVSMTSALDNTYGGDITSLNGAVTIVSNGGSIKLSGGTINAGTGAISLRTPGSGDINLDSDLTSSSTVRLNSSSGTVTISANIDVSSATTAAGPGIVSINASTGILRESGGVITLPALRTASGSSFTFKSGGDITIDVSTGAELVVGNPGPKISGNSTSGEVTLSNVGPVLSTLDIIEMKTTAGFELIGGLGTVILTGQIFDTEGTDSYIRSGEETAGIIIPNSTTRLFPKVVSPGTITFDGVVTLNAYDAASLSETGLTVISGSGINFFKSINDGSISEGDVPAASTKTIAPTLNEQLLLLNDGLTAFQPEAFVGTARAITSNQVTIQYLSLGPLSSFRQEGGSIDFGQPATGPVPFAPTVSPPNNLIRPTIYSLGSVTFDSANIRILENTYITAQNDVYFGGTVNADFVDTAGVFNVNTINTVGDGGQVIFNGAIGGSVPLGGLEVSTSGGDDYQININAGAVTFAGKNPVKSGARGQIELNASGSIVLAGNISSTGEANTIGGDLTFEAGVGEPINPDTDSIPQNIQLGGNLVTRGGNITFNSPLFVTASSSIDNTLADTTGTIIFGRTSPIDQGGELVKVNDRVFLESSLILASGGAVTFNGDLNGSGSATITIANGQNLILLGGIGNTTPLGGFTVSAGSGDVLLSSDISTRGGPVSFGMRVRLGDDISIDTTLLNSPNGSTIEFLQGVIGQETSAGSFVDEQSYLITELGNTTANEYIAVGATAFAAGTLQIGQEYIITAIGNTDFTSVGASSNTPGTVFTATGAGTGTGTTLLTFFTATDVGEGTGTADQLHDINVSGGISGRVGFGASAQDTSFSAKINSLTVLNAGTFSVTSALIGYGANSSGYALDIVPELAAATAGGDNILQSSGDGNVILRSGINTSFLTAEAGDVTIRSFGTGTVEIAGSVSMDGGSNLANTIGFDGGNLTVITKSSFVMPNSISSTGGTGTFVDGKAGNVLIDNSLSERADISFRTGLLDVIEDSQYTLLAGRDFYLAQIDATDPDAPVVTSGVVLQLNRTATGANFTLASRGSLTIGFGGSSEEGYFYAPSGSAILSYGGNVNFARLSTTTAPVFDANQGDKQPGGVNMYGTIFTTADGLASGSVAINPVAINQLEGLTPGLVTLGSITTRGGVAAANTVVGSGGGAVNIKGTTVDIRGLINSSGGDSLDGGTDSLGLGGSAGAITIEANSIKLARGLTATGGQGLSSLAAYGGGGGDITFTGNLTLDSGSTKLSTILINTSGGLGLGTGDEGAGGNIDFKGTLTGTKTTSNILDLRYGSGTVTMGDALADKITMGTLITAADDALSTGTLVINGLLVVDSLITYARGYSLSILGAGTEFSSLYTFLNTGTVGLGASGVGVTFEGGFNSTAAASTQLNGLVNTGSAQSLGNGGNMVMGAVILANNSTLNSNGNDITLTTIDNDPAILAKDLTFASGIGSTGSVTIAGAVGSTTAVGTVTVNSTGPVAFASSFNGGGIVTAAGTTTSFSGGTSIQDALNGITTTGVTSLNGTVTLVNSLYATDTTQVFTLTSSGAFSMFSMPGTVTMSGGPFALAGGGSFTVAGTLNGSQPLILSGTSTKTFSGSLTVGNGTTAIAGTESGVAIFSGTTNLKGASSFANPVTLGSSLSASGATVMSGDLTLAGGGGTLGGTGDYIISSISGVGQALTYSGSGSANVSGVLNLGSITGSGSGTMTFAGDVTSANASSFVGLVKLGGVFTTTFGTTSFNTIDLTGTSTLVGNLEASGALIGNNQSLTLGAGTQQFLSATGLGALTIQGGITSFSSGLTGTSLSQTSSGTLTLNGSTSFRSAATLDAGTTLNLNGISFSADSVALAGTLNGSGNTIVSGSLTLGATGDLNSTTTGGLLSLKNGLVLQRNFSMDGAGNYSVSGSITRDGSAQSLTFDGAGTKTLSGNLGTLGGRLGAVTQAVGSGSVSFGGDIFSDGITMDAATLVNGTVEIDSNAATQSYQSITLAGSLNLITSSDAENAVTLGSGGVNGTGDLSVLPTNSAKLEVGGAIANAGTFNVIRSGSIVLGGSSGYLSAAEVNLIRSTGGANFESNAGTLDASGIIVNTSLGLDGKTGVQVSNITVNGDLNLVTVGVASFTGDLSTAQSLQISADSIESGGTPGTLSLVSTPRLRSITLSGSGADFSYSPSGNLNLSGRINLNNGDISLSPTGNFVNSFNGNPFTANSTRILTRDLFSSWPSNGAVPGLQVVYGVNSIGQVGANQIGVSTTLLAGNAAPYILEFTTGTGQPYILAQQTAIPPVMLPAALTGGNGFARSVTYSADEIEMMTPEERSAYENQQRQVSARVILQGQSGVGEEIGAPTDGRTPQAATPAALAPVAPTAQVLLEGKPLAGARSDQERGDATKIIKLRPTRAVALRPSYQAADVMESERMAAEVSVGAAPVAQSR